ncbi:phosphatase 2C-domain-containing protein [Protomyces lactucae-debilis]|uniref:protein-serine/threonine phosphatase n=1 Tax=Protomyces lactucae-debilis TaxID=2754530 RepID=A0A1Y2FGM8_PROLT|nr:phosphatase 2C-domain-containing protein [Protomyces lactucae-debilis]ORY83079.1 phosphatase 2C-domain-containing protein [Protomyces lactucae-debilis]
MGQTLATPVVEKHSSNGADELYIYGISDMQGWRISMEDAHAAILNLTEASGKEQVSVFAVYDGHGAGANVALFTGDRLHRIVAAEDAFKKKDYEAALKSGFLATDRAILGDRKFIEDPSGCTATVNLITEGKIYCANAGDSRTVLGSKGNAIPLSQDHKPQNAKEKERICAAGGFVDFDRVNGNLALSRAIGDFEFKKNKDLPAERQIVTADPDVKVHEITQDDEFLVVACDGIWDCKSSQEVIEFVRRGVVAGQELHVICENLMDNCLASSSDGGGVGCDNMTVMVVGLLQGKSKEEWYKMVQDRVANNEGPCAPESAAELKPPQFDQFQSNQVRYGSFKGNEELSSSSEEENEEEDESEEKDDGKTPAKKSKKDGSIVVLNDGSELLRQKEEKEAVANAEAAEREEAAKDTDTDKVQMDTSK